MFMGKYVEIQLELERQKFEVLNEERRRSKKGRELVEK